MSGPTLTEFLLARIAEDEAAAGAAIDIAGRNRWWVDGPSIKSGKYWVYATGEKFADRPVADHIARHDPARVLVECEVKRRVIERHGSGSRSDSGMTECDGCNDWWPCADLRDLAAVFDGHQDYDEAWRP